MAIDSNKIRWASVDEVDPLTGLPNKEEPSEEFKNTGLKDNQGLALQWLNNQFNEQYNAMVDLQEQIDAITGGSSQPTLEAVYPLGAVYMSYQNTNPNTVFGFGTWAQVEGKFIVGVDTGDIDFDTAGKTGGSKSHTHTDTLSVDGHTLTVDELPPHEHDVDLETISYDTGATGQNVISQNETGLVEPTDSTGGGDPHSHTISGGVQSSSNLDPYFAVYIWHRTA